MAAAIAMAQRAACALLACALASSLQAQDVPPPAYQLAAQRAGIPAAVLYAVALQESGVHLNGRLVPWPWSLNVAGESRRFATRDQACSNLQRALHDIAPTRIDVGLGQINLGYQRHRYRRACDVLNPYRNLALAADILREHHSPGDDWLLAIGRYHRPAGGAPAARYRHSVGQHLARVLGQPTASPRRTQP